MHELFLLIAMMVATIILMGGMMVLFKGYFNEREKIDRAAFQQTARQGPDLALAFLHSIIVTSGLALAGPRRGLVRGISTP